MRQTAFRLLLLTLLLPGSGCVAFSNVRPARVHEGLSGDSRASVTTNLGTTATTLWGVGDLSVGCHPGGEAAAEYSARYGFRPGGGDPGIELALGFMTPLQPFAEGYVGLAQDGPVAYGVGGRVPLRVHPDQQLAPYRLDGRLDWQWLPRVRVLGNPGLFHYREHDSRLTAIVPALGLHIGGEGLFLTPSVAWILGWGRAADSCLFGEPADFRISGFAFSLGVTLVLTERGQ